MENSATTLGIQALVKVEMDNENLQISCRLNRETGRCEAILFTMDDKGCSHFWLTPSFVNDFCGEEATAAWHEALNNEHKPKNDALEGELPF